MVTESIDRLDVLLRVGRHGEAAKLAAEVLASDPGSVPAWYAMATAKDSLGDLAEATAAFEEVIRLRPSSPKAWAFHSNLLFRRNRVDEAVAAAREAIRLAPDHYLPHLMLAQARKHQRGGLPEAADAAARALSFESRNAHCYQIVADIAQRRGDLDTAESTLVEALRIAPNSATVHNQLAIVRHSRNRLLPRAEAIAGLAEALAIAPDRKYHHDNLVVVVYRLAVNSWKAALACLLFGLVAGVGLFNAMLDGARGLQSPAQWGIAAATSLVVASPAIVVSLRFLRRIPARLRRGVVRIGLSHVSIRIRLAGSAAAVATAITQPLVPQFPVVFGGVAVLVGSIVAARLAGRPGAAAHTAKRRAV